MLLTFSQYIIQNQLYTFFSINLFTQDVQGFVKMTFFQNFLFTKVNLQSKSKYYPVLSKEPLSRIIVLVLFDLKGIQRFTSREFILRKKPLIFFQLKKQRSFFYSLTLATLMSTGKDATCVCTYIHKRFHRNYTLIFCHAFIKQFF